VFEIRLRILSAGTSAKCLDRDCEMTTGRYRALLVLFFFGGLGLALGAADAQISRNQFGPPDSASVSQFALTYYVD